MTNMTIKSINLYEYFGVSKQEECVGDLTCYIHKDYDFAKDRFRPAILIVAGGGYANVSEREKEPVALKYIESGFNCFILDYSTAPKAYPTQLIEGIMAMLYIRQNAEKLSIDKAHVAALGFSAGAHLCGLLATIEQDEIPSCFLEWRADDVRPNAVVLGYPVVSALNFSHKGSVQNISGGNEALYSKLSIENRVNIDSAPAFIWGCLDDPVVDSNNGFMLAQAYKKIGVAFEYHLFESCNGVHGLSICEKETLYENETVKLWVELSKNWLKNRGFLLKDCELRN